MCYIHLIDHVLYSSDQVAVVDSINRDLKQGVNFQGHNASPQMTPVSSSEGGYDQHFTNLLKV